jgi:monoamine oxidase
MVQLMLNRGKHFCARSILRSSPGAKEDRETDVAGQRGRSLRQERHGRTPLFRRLRRALARERRASSACIPTGEFIERFDFERGPSRRQFLEASSRLGVLASFPALACSAKHPEPSGGPRIAVVGAGVAGLTAAYRLGQAGLGTPVFDSWNSGAGRMLTARGMWADQQLTELGGELIDTGHGALRGLAERTGPQARSDCKLPVAVSDKTPGSLMSGVLDAELVEAFRPVAVRL